MRIQLLNILILLSLLLSCSYSDDNIYTDLLPLSVGNTWVYRNWGMLPGPNRSKLTVTGTHIYNGKFFYELQLQFNPASGCMPNPLSYNVYNIRVDSLTGKIFYHNTVNCSYSPGEILIDSLASKKENTFLSNCEIAFRCTDTNSYTVFGSLRACRRYMTVNSISEYYIRKYYRGIGLYEQSHGFTGVVDCNSLLLGAVINGTLIGDTSFLVGINQINENIPIDFKLFRNYPNPFNPSTKIRFDISGKSVEQTFLTVYDLLGNEIAALVNQQLQPGTYEVDFDGSNFPSGVYFYKLTSGDFSAINKMVLLK